MLRSDLDELFTGHADKTLVVQPDDWDKPAEVLLSGTCTIANDEGGKQGLIHIRQRIDQYGIDYLIIFGRPGDCYWGQVTDKGAWTVVNGNPFTQEDAMTIRRLVSPELTVWSAAENQHWLAEQHPFDMADHYKQIADDKE